MYFLLSIIKACVPWYRAKPLMSLNREQKIIALSMANCLERPYSEVLPKIEA
jgi:hypothetical protein|tara:strand:+ start:5562 stop:5717 length:156 start_codon:yes stop_codon:yes gene_type:complete